MCTGSARDSSPYKKSTNSSPGHIPNRLQLGECARACSSACVCALTAYALGHALYNYLLSTLLAHNIL